MLSEFPIPERFRSAIKDIVHQMVVGNYAGLADDGRAGEFTAEQLQDAMGQYDLTLLELPDDVWQNADADAFHNEERGYWDIDVPLWTVEEGRSDFTLQLGVCDGGDDFKMFITELHVL